MAIRESRKRAPGVRCIVLTVPLVEGSLYGNKAEEHYHCADDKVEVCQFCCDDS